MYLLSGWVAFSVQTCADAHLFTLYGIHTSQGPSVAGIMEEGNGILVAGGQESESSLGPS